VTRAPNARSGPKGLAAEAMVHGDVIDAYVANRKCKVKITGLFSTG
jgi:hypothetical protein